MKTSKKLIACIALASLFLTATPASAARTYVDNGITCTEGYYPTGNVHEPSPTMNEPPTIHVDGRYLTTDVDPIIVNGRTLLPFRAAGEAIGASINWDQATQTATATKDGKVVAFTLDSTTYTINGTSHTTDIAPTILSNRTLLPLRAFAEAFDADVEWDQYLYDVTIDTSAANAPSPIIPANASVDAAKFIQKYYIPSDPSNLYVGSWKYSTTSDYGHTDTYLFIAPTSDGYQYVEISIENGNLTLDTITIMRDHAYYQNSGDPLGQLLVNYDNLPLYYRGGPRGWELSFTHIYTLRPDGSLCKIASITQPFGDYNVILEPNPFVRF